MYRGWAWRAVDLSADVARATAAVKLLAQRPDRSPFSGYATHGEQKCGEAVVEHLLH